MTVLQSNAPEGANTISHEIGSIVDARAHENSPIEEANAQSMPIGATVEELERGILNALRLGLVDVARKLNGQLEDRRRALVPGNVVAITHDGAESDRVIVLRPRLT